MTTETGRRAGILALLPAAVLVLAALCLRGPFAAVGPVLDELGTELSLSTAALAVVTSLPLVCFGLVSPFAPTLAGRLGLHRAVLAAVAVILAGILLRLAGTVGLFAGTVVLTGGIAVVNVLLPAVARAEYGRRSAAVIGATTGSMALSASLGAGTGPAARRRDGQRRRRAGAVGAPGAGRAHRGRSAGAPRVPTARPHPPRPAAAPPSSATAWRWPSWPSSASSRCRSTRC